MLGDVKFVKKTDKGYIINVHVIPNSKKIRVEQEENHIKIYLTAPPVKGKANRELIRLLSNLLGIPKKCIKIEKGETSRNKQILLLGLSNIEASEIVSRIINYS